MFELQIPLSPMSMKPKIADLTAWHQAEILMQPAFIRIIDNLRKQLDETDWRGTYEEVLLWPDGTPEELRDRVLQLRAERESADSETATTLDEQLAGLPAPFPGHILRLQKGDREVRIDLWDLCYQVCFVNYAADAAGAVTIDTQLLEEDSSDVDWNRLEEKTRGLIEGIFAGLPEIGA